jgi:hypothetical protein
VTKPLPKTPLPAATVFTTEAELNAYFAGDKLVCLECGRSLKMLCAHLTRVHGITSDMYRERHGIPWTRGLTGNGTKEKKRDAAAKSGNLRPSTAEKLAVALKSPRRTYQAVRHDMLKNMTRRRSPPPEHATLTRAAQMLAEGLADARIASELGLSRVRLWRMRHLTR